MREGFRWLLFMSLLCLTSSSSGEHGCGRTGLFAFAGPLGQLRISSTSNSASCIGAHESLLASLPCGTPSLPFQSRRKPENALRGVRALRAAAFGEGRRMNENPTARVWSDVVTVSPEFCSLCQAQFEVRHPTRHHFCLHPSIHSPIPRIQSVLPSTAILSSLFAQVPSGALSVLAPPLGDTQRECSP
jgi:hypothetical protein